MIIRRDPPPGLEFSAASGAATERIIRRESRPSAQPKFCRALVSVNLANRKAIWNAKCEVGPSGIMVRARMSFRKWNALLAGCRRTCLRRARRAVHNDYKYDNLVLDPRRHYEELSACWIGRCARLAIRSLISARLSHIGWMQAIPEGLQKIRWGPTTNPGSMTRAQIAKRYAEETGRDISQLDFYLVFARFKVAVIVQQIYYRYHQGLTKDERFPRHAYTCGSYYCEPLWNALKPA